MNSKFFLVSKVGLTFIFCFQLLVVKAQSDTIYIDENDKKVSKSIFYNKAKSSIYRGVRFSTDTLVLEKLRFKYFFGKLNPQMKSQFCKLLYKRHQIDTSKTLVIHYIDTLKSKSDFPKRSRTVFYDSLGREIKLKNSNKTIDFSQQKKIARHKHIIGYADFISAHKRCERKHKKYNRYAEVLHFYRYNSGHPTEYKGLNWYKDYGGIIRKIFSDSYKNFNIVIFHPNGEFYLGCNKQLPYRDLIKKRKWDDYKNDFLKRVKALTPF